MFIFWIFGQHQVWLGLVCKVRLFDTTFTNKTDCFTKIDRDKQIGFESSFTITTFCKSSKIVPKVVGKLLMKLNGRFFCQTLCARVFALSAQSLVKSTQEEVLVSVCGVENYVRELVEWIGSRRRKVWQTSQMTWHFGFTRAKVINKLNIMSSSSFSFSILLFRNIRA